MGLLNKRKYIPKITRTEKCRAPKPERK